MPASSNLPDDVPEVPANLRPAMSEAEQAAKEGRGWRRDYSSSGALRKWAQTIDNIGNYREHGSDDYQHLLSYRVVLHHLLTVLDDLGHGDASAWLQRQVDELDQKFQERSSDDAEPPPNDSVQDAYRRHGKRRRPTATTRGESKEL